MNDSLEALKELKEYWLNHLPLSVKDGLRIVKVLEEEIKEKEEYIKALEIIFKYISIGNPFGNVHYIYLNDESEMIMPKDFEELKGVLKR